MAKMYINQEDADQKPFIWEEVSLTEYSVPIAGGSCDYPFGFKSNNGKAVYLPNGSLLLDKKEIYYLKVEPDKKVENSSEFGCHKDGISLFRFNRGKLEEAVSPETIRDKKLRFLGSP